MTKLLVAIFVAMALIPAKGMAGDAKGRDSLAETNSAMLAALKSGVCWRESDWVPICANELCDAPEEPLAAGTALDDLSQPAPQPQSMSVSADATFAFDTAELTSEDRLLLDELARQVNRATYSQINQYNQFSQISVIGHADRLGGEEHNRKLSERRAISVKDYLISKSVPASRITVQGKGATEPVTRSGECAGPKSARTIVCLQPDRRVDVVMRGTEQITSSR